MRGVEHVCDFRGWPVVTIQVLLLSSGIGFQFTATISVDTYNYNVGSAATSAGWDGTSILSSTIVNNATIGSTSTGSPAFTAGTLPTGSRTTLTNNSYIVGKGGDGGTPEGDGDGGGLAISMASPVFINNLGTIGGGGGGGGGGHTFDPGVDDGGGGGGGAGQDVGIGGPGGSNSDPGDDGSLTSGGGGGRTSGAGSQGGGGGDLGAAGANGAGSPHGSGGSAGSATSGFATYGTWITMGTVLGTVG